MDEKIVPGVQAVAGKKPLTLDESPDESGEMKLRVGDVVLGAYTFLGPAPTGVENFKIPDDGKHGIAFPILVDGQPTVCRFVGSAPRAIAMFAMHKFGRTIVPLTEELRKMAASFDEHESIGDAWLYQAGFKLEDVIGSSGAEEIRELALKLGVAAVDEHGNLVRTGKPIPAEEEWEDLLR
jgi:hypothetical protein